MCDKLKNKKVLISGRKALDLTGQTFGELTVLGAVGTDEKGSKIWKCQCSCGNFVNVVTGRLRSGHTKSCGCLKTKYKRDLTKQRFGRLVATRRSESEPNKWVCKCDCGNIKEISEQNLIKGYTTSCGCFQKESALKRRLEDLTGKRFGRWTVLDYDKIKGNGYWICKCDCGTVKSVYSQSLKEGISSSCGCFKKENTSALFSLDIAGQKFGRLFVLRREGSFKGGDGTKYSTWLCQCECGNTKVVRGHDLVRGSVLSCGCLASRGEEIIRKILLRKNIKFETQVRFEDLKSDKGWPLRFDFKIYKPNKDEWFLLEYQGVQHSLDYVKYHENFGKQQREITDKLKKDYCFAHNIPFYEIWYSEDIETSLSKLLE